MTKKIEKDGNEKEKDPLAFVAKEFDDVFKTGLSLHHMPVFEKQQAVYGPIVDKAVQEETLPSFKYFDLNGAVNAFSFFDMQWKNRNALISCQYDAAGYIVSNVALQALLTGANVAILEAANDYSNLRRIAGSDSSLGVKIASEKDIKNIPDVPMRLETYTLNPIENSMVDRLFERLFERQQQSDRQTVIIVDDAWMLVEELEPILQDVYQIADKTNTSLFLCSPMVPYIEEMETIKRWASWRFDVVKFHKSDMLHEIFVSNKQTNKKHIFNMVLPKTIAKEIGSEAKR